LNLNPNQLSPSEAKMASRRTKEERIAALEAQIQKLKAKKVVVPKEIKLTKESSGIATAISAIENAAQLNDVSIAEVIKTIARIKRTGLKIESSVRKSKE
jgi:transposase